MRHFRVEWSAYAKWEAHSNHWMKKTSGGGTESVIKKNGTEWGETWGREVTSSSLGWTTSCLMWSSRSTLHPSSLTLCPRRWDIENSINGFPCPPAQGVVSPWEAPPGNWMRRWEWGKAAQYFSTIGTPTQRKQISKLLFRFTYQNDHFGYKI